jgi:hypothetical protein
MQDRDSSQDPRVSRGPNQPDGGVASDRIGSGGRGVSAGENLDEVQQQPGLDAPYGSRATNEETDTLSAGRGSSTSTSETHGDVGTAQGETPGKVAGTQF